MSASAAHATQTNMLDLKRIIDSEGTYLALAGVWVASAIAVVATLLWPLNAGWIAFLGLLSAVAGVLCLALCRRRLDLIIEQLRAEKEGFDPGMPSAENVEKTKIQTARDAALVCSLCGHNTAGILCWNCGKLLRGQSSANRVAAFFVRHGVAVLAFSITVLIPGLYGWWSKGNEDRRRAHNEELEKKEEDRQRKVIKAANSRAAQVQSRALAANVANSWAQLRAPLLDFGAHCGPIAAEQKALPDVCHELFGRAAEGYVRMSWYLPSFVAQVRSNCRDEPGGPDAGTGGPDAGDPQKLACALLEEPYPFGETGRALRRFVNAYAAYTPRSKGATRALGLAWEEFYCTTRRLGCELVFAELPGSVADRTMLSPACNPMLEGKTPTEDGLKGKRWFKIDGGDACSEPIPE